MRAWNRFAVFVSFCVSIFAGIGFSTWYSKEISQKTQNIFLNRKYYIPVLLIIVIATFELWPKTVPMQTVQPREVDRWLSEKEENFNIMEFPLTSSLSAPQMLYTKYHDKRIAFAYGTYFPYWYRMEYPELEQCPDPDCIDLLKSWDVKYVILSLDDIPKGPKLEKRFKLSKNLKLVHQFENEYIYKLIE